MEHLLCDESWLSDPLTPEPLPNFRRSTHEDNMAALTREMNAATVEEAISMDLEKESSFSNYGNKFVDFLVSNKLTHDRFQAIQWLIQTRNRLNLSFETLFSAANCFDRFVYLTSCDEWSNWMVELVIVTSLSIASKFNEVASPSLEEFQMEGLNHMFHHKTVLSMELIVLRALDWRLNSVTTHSFSQILASKIGLVGESWTMTRITDHLLHDLCDLKMLQYPPSVVGGAAMWNVLEENDNIETIMNLFGKEHKDNIVKCVDVMKSRNVDFWLLQRKECNVKSFVSMMREDVMNVNGDYHVGDLTAIFQILRSEGSDKKRDGNNNLQDKIRPAKRRRTIVMSI